MVIMMIAIGGITRLSGSGLSMVDWKPVTGIIPPITEAAWAQEYAKYQTFPEYSQYHYNLSEFKKIFYVEFIHRILARLTILVYVLPLLFFISIGIIKFRSIFSYIFILILFACQGLMGWYMVKSGLVNIPSVSHFRLSTHLIIAVIIYSLLFWQIMVNSSQVLIMPRSCKIRYTKLLCTIILALVYIQIFIGGMVAGLNAGLVYDTFPLMGDSWIPSELILTHLNVNDLYNPVFVHFIHRLFALKILICAIALSAMLLKSGSVQLRNCCYLILSAIVLQVITGAFTVLYHVNFILAICHQINAIFVLSSLLYLHYLLKHS